MSALLLVLPALLSASDPGQGPYSLESSAPLALTAAIELPGVEGRIDHLAVDLARERLFVAALGNDSVEVVDLKAGRHLRSLRGPPEPQGILYLADCDRMVVASGKAGTCDVYDGSSLERLASVEVGDDADNLRYDARKKLVYVAYGEGALGVVDATTWKRVGSVALAAHPESFQLDPDGERAYVNVPDAHQVAVVDLAARKVLATWDVDEAGANYPMALVPGPADAEPLVLLGCRSPSKLVLRSAPSGTKVGVLALSGDVDDIFFDAARGRVYAACGEGSVDVFDAKGALRPLTKIGTPPGARTALLVPERSELLVAVPHRGAQRAEIRVFRAGD